MSYLSFANLGYIWRKIPISERYKRIREACIGIDILTTDANQLHAALAQKAKDYEDMLQYQCALAANCDIIVTNNTRDYLEFCKLPLMTSREFLLDYFTNHQL